MFCADCGRLIADNARLCRYCGKPNNAANDSKDKTQNDTLYPPDWISSADTAHVPVQPEAAPMSETGSDEPAQGEIVLSAATLAEEYVQMVQDADDSENSSDDSPRTKNKKDKNGKKNDSDMDSGKEKKKKRKKTDKGKDKDKQEKKEKKSKKEQKDERKKEEKTDQKKDKKEKKEKHKEHGKKGKKKNKGASDAEIEPDQEAKNVEAAPDDRPRMAVTESAPTQASTPVSAPAQGPALQAVPQAAFVQRVYAARNAIQKAGFITSWDEASTQSDEPKAPSQTNDPNASAQANDQA